MDNDDIYEETTYRSERESRDDEYSEKDSDINDDSPIFSATPASEVSEFEFDDQDQDDETGMIIPIEEGERPEIVQPLTLKPRAQISPSDQNIIESIIDYYQSFQNKNFKPEEIYNMSKSDRYKMAAEMDLLQKQTKEIIDINIPLKRIVPHAQRMHISSYEYEYPKIKKLFVNRLITRLKKLRPDYQYLSELSDHIADLILNSNYSSDKKMELLGRILYQLEGTLPARNARYHHSINQQAYDDTVKFLNFFQNEIFNKPENILNSNLYLSGYIPEDMITQFTRLKKPILKPLEVEHIAPVISYDDETIDIIRLKYSITRELTDLLFKIYLKTLPDEKAESLVSELEGCDVINYTNCSVNIKNVIMPFKNMAESINNQIYNKYKDTDKYLAHISILLLHLNRETPMGYYSTKFQQNIFRDPSIAVYGDYEENIYPPLFRSKSLDANTRKYLWEFTQDELKDELKQLRRNIKIWQGLRVPMEIEQIYIDRLSRQNDVERMLDNFRDEYTIKQYISPSPAPVKTDEKIYSVTSGKNTYSVNATKNTPELLFGEETFYMIRYLPDKNSYVILKFTLNDDDTWSGSVIGVTKTASKNISKALGLDFSSSYELDEIMNKFGAQDFYIIESLEFDENADKLAKIFSKQTSKSSAPLQIIDSTIKPSKNTYFDINQLLHKMGGQVS